LDSLSLIAPALALATIEQHLPVALYIDIFQLCGWNFESYGALTATFLISEVRISERLFWLPLFPCRVG
jgi:hypothetical protein